MRKMITLREICRKAMQMPALATVPRREASFVNLLAFWMQRIRGQAIKRTSKSLRKMVLLESQTLLAATITRKWYWPATISIIINTIRISTITFIRTVLMPNPHTTAKVHVCCTCKPITHSLKSLARRRQASKQLHDMCNVPIQFTKTQVWKQINKHTHTHRLNLICVAVLQHSLG